MSHREQISVRLSRSFVVIGLVIAVCVGNTTLYAQTVVTSQGTFVLTPPGELVGPEAARSASRVAELAMSAVLADANAVVSEQNALDAKIADYNIDRGNYEADLSNQTIRCNAYETDLSNYETDANLYVMAVDYHDGRVLEYNSRADEAKDVATYNDLMASKTRLDGWQSELDDKADALDLVLEDLLIVESALNERYNHLNNRYNQLNSDWIRINAKLGLAYNQLVTIQNYAVEINKLLVGWKEPVLNTYNLNTSLEQLKALSNKGWD